MDTMDDDNKNHDNDIENNPNAKSNVSPPLVGRVVRLHFRCKAELPIGSFLRVTGSTLWAPGSSALDPTNAHQIAEEETAQSLPDGGATANSLIGGSAVGNPSIPGEGIDDPIPPPSTSSLYTSSVELVTTPETYPIWKTRRPVVVVLHKKSRNQVQHHYYRYLVVTPGESIDHILASKDSITNNNEVPPLFRNTSDGNKSDDNITLTTVEDDGDATAEMIDELGGIVSTSDDYTGSTSVMSWEDPFNNLQRQTKAVGGTSMLSLRSTASTVVVGPGGVPAGSGQIKSNLMNLPYRTLDINVAMGKPIYQNDDDDEQEGDVDIDNDGNEEGGKEDADLVRMDNWNYPDDESFRPYLIREAMNEENRRKLQLQTQTSAITDTSMDETPIASGTTSPYGSGMATPPMGFPQQSRIYFVCFHLPVVVVQNKETKVWRASWSESILAKSEGSRALRDVNTHWIGTVTTHPPISSEADKEQVRNILADMDCTPIFLEPSVRQAHYYGFCKQVLWPAFHNIDLLDISSSGLVGLKTISGPDDTTSDWDQSRLDDWWKAYQDVNAKFASVMGTLIRPNDILWIHDYHLSLLPSMMSQIEIQKYTRQVTRKIFFLHIPFPTSQIFRELECGEEILEGMLHADVVGFHAFDHARHFLNAAKRILGLNYESLVGGLIGVNFQGKTVLVTMSNVSIEPKLVDAALNLPSVEKGYQLIRKRGATDGNERIILGAIDIGQQLSGIALKLLAYERLLQDYPTWQTRVIMIQKVLIPGSRKADEAFTIREVRALIKRIQDKFGPDVIDYQELSGSSLPMDQRLALWKACDVLMMTPIREGLNHWPMEYVYAHKEPARPGVVIASEFSAVCSILNGALRVNPFDIQMTITTIDKALSMDEHEREGRRYRDMHFVSTTHSDQWVKNVLRDLRDATMRPQYGSGAGSASQADSAVSTPRGSSMQLYGLPGIVGGVRKQEQLIDSTAAFLAREANLAFEHLKIGTLKKAYDCTNRRVIILDFNGTIVLKEPPGKYLKREILGTSGNKPPPQVIEALENLCQDRRNDVFVVSGDSYENVMSALGHIPNLGLATSNGARFSPPPLNGGEAGQKRRWKTFDLGVDWDAVKRVALPVLSKYTARSNGSFVKLTSFSIGWSYYSCDPEWGSLQASHLVLELETELRAFDVRFVTLKGIVEIVPRKLNKGLIVRKILRDITVRAAAERGENEQHEQDDKNKKNDTGINFILCAGDDISDEKMFTSVFTYIAELGDDTKALKPSPPVINEDGSLEIDATDNDTTGALKTIRDPMFSYTVAVGKKPSHASFYVNDAQEVANLLVMLATGEMPTEAIPVWGRENASHLFT